ncbi:MAG: helix-hairpin-helix domain-containing protein [Bacteroidota bacterium]
MKRFFKSLFGTSSKEVSGLLVLILLLSITLLLPRMIRGFTNSDDSHFERDNKELDSLVTYLEDNYSKKEVDTFQVLPPHIFNPNNASVDELIALGFNSSIAKRINNYREKGGVFRIKNDLYKIYSIDSALLDRLYAYIDLPEKHKKKVATRVEEKHDQVVNINPVRREIEELPRFDINLADTSMLQTIKGIGSVLSKRIIGFRNKLGGFIDMNQLFEVYNLDSTVVEKLIEKTFVGEDFKPNALLINQFDEKELANHPYISWQQARLITSYRAQHGNFESADDLIKVYAIKEDDILKINSYISWESDN